MTHSATLSVNLSALCANYRLLQDQHAKKKIAAVVKANAYGLGMPDVSKALAAEGCRLFFVATLDEAIELRAVLPESDIAVFNGIFAGEEKTFAEHRIIPVINSLEQIATTTWHADYMLHVDTGMTRLGLSHGDLSHKSVGSLPLSHCQLLISHLACADEPTHHQNAEQLARLNQAREFFPGVAVSFANSAGLFLPEAYHFDIGRPGCALYGINPTAQANPMQSVVILSAPILQIRTLEKEESIGYDALYRAPKGARIAMVALGYADGYFRSLSNRGFAYIEGYKVPIAGCISMDMIALDVSNVPEEKVTANSRAEFINAHQTVDDLALQCDTVGYEIFTRIGRRVKRVYDAA